MRLYMPGALRRWDQGKYNFAGLKPESDAVTARPSEKGRTIVLRLDTNRSELIAAQANPKLQIHQVVNPGEITIAGLGAAVAMLDACSADLLERWGYPKQLQSKIATPPKIKDSWASYVTSDDYPLTAIFARAGGETHILVDVGANGIGSNCRVILRSGREEIDQTTCKVAAERARYTPALDSDGNPVAAPTYMVFRWEMPTPRWY
jgi:outer membrane biosynthesis protein TonB